ncbi:MAG: valine--tRNA ligase [Gammaproteobacteria bacterium]|nr:valine--tRNA ligase [Gammaproteobacteria bacterium]
MGKQYEPAAIERRHYQRWEDNNWFAPANPGAEPYCIMIPPPNVTGSLHMGHAFQDLIMDALIRYHRMRGRNVLWQPGTDHAGIATQMLVERAMNADGKTRHDYGREKFIDKVWEWKEQFGGTIAGQLRRLGASADWSNERFTMDAGLSEAVKEVFVRLYDEGLIYRGKRLVNWDPVLLTAVSDLEVVSEEESGVMYYVRYPFVGDEDNGIIIGTTRPETILVDGAVAVHPDDARYQKLTGRQVWVPMTEPRRAIEIIADDYVQADFGSGCVKVSAAHDFNDYQVYLRHPDKDIPLIILFTPDAKMNDNAPQQYRGLDRYDARKQIVRDLREQGLLIKEEPHRYKLPRGDRSGAVVEPMLTDQWYVDLTRETLDDGRPGGKTRITAPAIAAVRDARVQFVPENWSKTYYQWLEHVEDWCISRQIWWGHRIPAWYDDDGNVFVGADEAAVREKYRLPASCKLRQDDDVLDTWFSSALWPFSTLGWPQQTERLQTFYPTSVLVTGFDIIFFWVARMVMFGVKFMDEVPFHQVYIHGLVRDAHGRKMSKSKGNVLDPIDLIDGIDLQTLVEKRTSGLMRPQDAAVIEKQTRADFPDGIPGFGADALRFTFAALASTGRDINFDLGRVEGYRNFCNKIWNAARFVLMNTEGEDCGDGGGGCQLGIPDRWILSRLQQTAAEVEQAFDAYRLDLAAQCLYSFVWDEYCSWYLELCKTLLGDAEESAARKAGARRTLIQVLETLLRLLHPLMPFITEEIWLRAAKVAGAAGETIMLQPWPRAGEEGVDLAAVREMEKIKEVVGAVRNIRGEMNLDPGRPLPVALQGLGGEGEAWLVRNRKFLLALARLSSVEAADPRQDYAHCATALAGGIKVLVTVSAADREREQARLAREREKIRGDLARIEAKLANKSFVEKAPAEVVDKDRRRREELQRALADLG